MAFSPRTKPSAQKGWLHVTVVRAEDLLAADSNGLSDPFVRLKVDEPAAEAGLAGGHGAGASSVFAFGANGKVHDMHQPVKTDVVNDSLNPIWTCRHWAPATWILFGVCAIKLIAGWSYEEYYSAARRKERGVLILIMAKARWGRETILRTIVG